MISGRFRKEFGSKPVKAFEIKPNTISNHYCLVNYSSQDEFLEFKNDKLFDLPAEELVQHHTHGDKAKAQNINLMQANVLEGRKRKLTYA